MSEKRKISVRKIMQTLVTVLVTGACITAMLSAARKQDAQHVKDFSINIKNEKYGFIDKAEVKYKLLHNKDIDVRKISLGKLNIGKMEEAVATNPWVADAQVYVDNEKVVHVNLTQRVPVARLFDQSGNSYYLDNTLAAMPLSDRYIHYTTVVTNVPVLKNDSMGNALKAQIVKLVKHIERDSFWAAQVSQVIMDDDKNFELVPVLGNHRILIGDTTNLKEKFENLYAFYKKVMVRIGWDKYEVLDVRYKGQVVASPALPWKPPTDKAMSNMNWVKSIIGNDTNKVVAPLPKPVTLQPQASAVTVAKPVPASTAAPTTPKPVAKPTAPKPIAKPAPTATKQPEPKATIKKEDKKTEPKKQDNKEKPKQKEQNKEEQKPKYLYQ
jgi:cell division protein FtsQ